jgi:hypothetical protein
MIISSYQGPAAPLRRRRLAGALLAAAAALPATLGGTACLAQEGYTLTIDGTSYPIGLDSPADIVLPDGSSMTLLLLQDEFTSYGTETFSFLHKSSYKPARIDIGPGIFQTAILTPLGTGVIIQEYSSLNPASLIGLMLNEVTKEERDYGYDYEESEVSQEVGDKVVSGRQAITTYKDETWIRSVYAYGTRDSGLLILTMVQKAHLPREGALLDDFWRTLEIK